MKDKKVLVLVSGGVDSTVCAALVTKALSKDKVYALHIDNGTFSRQFFSTKFSPPNFFPPNFFSPQILSLQKISAPHLQKKFFSL